MRARPTEPVMAAVVSGSAKKLGAWLTRSGLKLELHLTHDIVSLPPGGWCDALVNPANEALVGTKLPYFPMKVDPPNELRSNEWCGMEVGEHMFYPIQVVDGLVHATGGREMLQMCQLLPELEPGVRCRVGSAVSTPATGELRQSFAHVVHTVPPMYAAVNWKVQLARCYEAALSVASCPTVQARTLASPLLGAGARGAPFAEAAKVAVETLAAIVPGAPQGGRTFRLSVQRDDVASFLMDEFQGLGLPMPSE